MVKSNHIPNITITGQIFDLLEKCLDAGISEWNYWNMTLAEITRYIESYNRIRQQKAKEIAINNYILADLIGQSIGRIYKGTYPSIQEAYPSLFQDDAEYNDTIQQQKDEASIRNFINFANAYNKKIGGEIEQ